MKRVIFLDFDGVVNGIEYAMRSDVINDFFAVNPISVDIVKRIAEENNAEVVASTSIRLIRDFDYFLIPFEKKGVRIRFKTPDYKGDRAREISDFVRDNNVEQFIILDDEIFDNLLKTISYEREDCGIAEFQNIIAYICENFQLEKSIIMNFADDISISIRDDIIEMVIIKNI